MGRRRRLTRALNQKENFLPEALIGLRVELSNKFYHLDYFLKEMKEDYIGEVGRLEGVTKEKLSAYGEQFEMCLTKIEVFNGLFTQILNKVFLQEAADDPSPVTQ